MELIYLDNAATTPLHPSVLESMMPFLDGHFGNPSSIHAFGRTAKQALGESRERISQFLGCAPGQLVFTSGGTESDNLALFGAARAQIGERKHIVASQIEHHAVLRACEQLEKFGYDVTYVAPDSTGRIRTADVEAAIRPETGLISVMYGNNETGTLQPVRQIGELARSKGIVFHVDAVQALGFVEMNLRGLPVDLMSFSAHKINGPKGTGALYVAEGIHLSPALFGGSQERGRRAGTENVAGIVGFAAAVDLIAGRVPDRRREMERLRRSMIDALAGELGDGGFVINGHAEEEARLGHIVNVSFPGTDTETLLMNLDLDGVAASGGAACSSGSLEPSHVLKAMKLPEEVVNSAVRFSFGWGNCVENVTIAALKTATIAKRIRN